MTLFKTNLSFFKPFISLISFERSSKIETFFGVLKKTGNNFIFNEPTYN